MSKIDYPMVREVIRNLVVKNQDEHLATVLLIMLEAIEDLESAPTPELQQSETPSSVATETQAGTSTGSTIYWSQSFHVKAGGNLRSYLRQGILDWLSSLKPLGVPLEVEIGVTLTSKAIIQQSGSTSFSQVGERSNPNGVAGESLYTPTQKDST